MTSGMSPMLSAALRYREAGFSVIPVRQDKKPFIPWETYQEELASPEQIQEWFSSIPKACVAIITGGLSGIGVIDIDTKAGAEILSQYLPEVYETPRVRTPRGGSHIYVAYQEHLGNAVGFIEGCDFRGQGGYVVAPPSIGLNGNPYAWEPYLSMDDVRPAPMPVPIYNILKNAFGGYGGTNVLRNNPQQPATNITLSFNKGFRDESLFHVAYALIKGGVTPDNALICLKVIASQCNPPFPEKEIHAKIESALKRISTKERNLTAELREWVSATYGNFSATSAYQDVTIVTREDKAKARVIFGRFVQEGLVERVPGKNGWYRRVESNCEEMDFLAAKMESLNIKLPFGLHDMVELMPGNIVLIAGEPNAGKTALLLNIIKDNMIAHEIHYFSSEMGPQELKQRLSKFCNTSLNAWRFKAYERSENFGDAIKPGKGKINIIDYLEIHDNFYEIGGRLAEVHRKLDGAIAVIALQKNKGVDTGLGGYRTLEKPRLALAMEPGVLKIVKAKNWKTQENPNGKMIQFKIHGGCDFVASGKWAR